MNSTVPDLVWCVYPISGSYTQFQRILFWAVIMLVLFFQFHDWLTAGLIAFAVTSSATAAAHTIFLGTQNSSVYDGDIFALENILQLSLFTSILFVLFSPRIFKTDVTPLYFWWCLLIFVARMIMQYTASNTIGAVDDIVLPVECNTEGLCQNPCDNLEIITMFRGAGDSLQPVIWSMIDASSFASFNSTSDMLLPDSATFGNWTGQASIKSDDGYDWLTNFWIWYAMIAPMLQFALVNSWIRPREARNYIFCRLRKRYVPKTCPQSKAKLIYIYTLLWARYIWILLRTLSLELYLLQSLVKLLVWIMQKVTGRKVAAFHEIFVLEVSPSRFRYIIAKIVAIMWYGWANGSYVLFVGVTIFFLYKAETSMAWIPESESKKAVGQWSPWMAFGLAVVAAIFVRITSKPEQNNKRRINLGEIEVDNKQPYEMALMAKELSEDNWLLHQYLGALLIYEWHDFKFWWQNTIEASAEKPTENEGMERTEEEKREDILDPWDKIISLDQVAIPPNVLPRGINLAPESSRPQADGSYGYDYDFMEEDEYKEMVNKLRSVEGKVKKKYSGRRQGITTKKD